MDESKQRLPISNETYVSLALALTLIVNIAAGAYMFGVQTQKISALEERLSKQESYALDVATMKEQIRQFGLTLAEVRTDVKSILSAGND